jgi:hypothetical protein
MVSSAVDAAETAMKRVILTALAIYVLWAALDFVIHGVLLMGLYEATADLWRPEAEWKMGLMQVVAALSAFIFVYLYHLIVTVPSMQKALTYGFLYGFVTGLGMGYGTYAFMPVPYTLALSWLLASVFQATAAGWVLGWMLPGRKGLASASPPG